MPSFDNAPLSPYGLTPPSELLLNELSDVRTIQIAKNVDIGFTILNTRLLGNVAPVVAIGGFMSDLTTQDRAYEGAQLATLGRPVLMLDLPGHGLSTPHSAKQTIDLCVRKNANSQAAPLVEAVGRIIGPNDTIDYFGVSHGGYMALKSAQLDPGDRVSTVFGIDVPAVKRRTTLGLQAGYVIADNLIGAKNYLHDLKGTAQELNFEAFKNAYLPYRPQKAPNFIKNNPGFSMLNLFTSINARPGALESWSAVMQTKSANVRVVTSQNGHVSNPQAIADFINALPPAQQKRSSQTVINGENHNIGITHLMPRAVAWAKQAYEL